MKNNTLSPLLLPGYMWPTDEGTFPIGYTSSVAPLDIYNPNKTAMLIDQLRFRVGLAKTTDDRFGVDPWVLGALGIEVLLGAIPLTNSFVTLGSLCPRYTSLQPTDAVLNFNGPGSDPVAVWHFPKPLYVPPLVQLSIRANRQRLKPSDNDETLIENGLGVAVVGRSLPSDFPVPGEIDVPWVTETKVNDPTLTRFVSKDSDLVNKNNVPLDVYQFTGFNIMYPGTLAGTILSQPNPTFTVQMSASNGVMLVRDPVPFFTVFPTSKNILPLNARLQSGEFFRAELEVGTPDVVGIDKPIANLAFTSVAMHGSRKIQTPGTLG